MSSSVSPISPARFSSAIKDLPLGNLHSSASELRNSIAHLRSSNEQLRPFTEGENTDKECADAIKENEEVIGRMIGRIGMLKVEVERRGFKWVEPEDGVVSGHIGGGEEEREGQEEDNSAERIGSTRADTTTTRPSHGGRIGDEVLRRLVEERLHGDHDDGDGGLDL